MSDPGTSGLLAGKKGLVLNITNKNSIGWAIAEAAHLHGAEVGVGGQNERLLESVLKLIEGQPRFKSFTIDFGNDAEYDQLVEQVKKSYGSLDFVVHSAAFAPKEAMQGKFIDTTREDFAVALDVSCYSFLKLAATVKPLMNPGGSLMTLTYLGSVRAMRAYNVMGVAKAALESTMRYLAIDLGEVGVRVNALSPGPMNTVAARGVPGLREMIDFVSEKAPMKRAAVQEDVGGSAVYLLSELSSGVTGEVIYVDAGYNIMAM
ncbi:MAG TPA: enoyl-ACP reductase [Fimbriimonadaceae bacterium]|nr:enoyl-ACP reductase [Fimbriimonadaceae bacterium]